MTSRYDEIASNLNRVREQVKEAAASAGRKHEDITLIAVTKTFPVSDVHILASLDVHHYGENRDSDAAPKAADNLITIKSPMIGTFYRKPAPDKPNFVEEGDEVRNGKVVCVIEAMKLFNEIESEVSGKIVKILVEDASPVEYDQPLFLVEPA
ncbi:MAG: acetyl-CoA carboxylase biotin carboxyl carrier protein [Bacteroidota bacterium]